MKNIKKHITPKRIAIISAGITLVSFLYKIGLGIISLSIILMIASISTLVVFVCKLLFVINMEASREKKKKAYFIMMIMALSFGVLFLLFAVLKVGGIDTASKNKFSGWAGVLFILFVILMFVLSILNLRGALQKDDITLLGLKEMIFISALADAVIIEEFLYKVILVHLKLPFMNIINNYFPIITAVFMLSIPYYMFKRFKNYQA